MATKYKKNNKNVMKLYIKKNKEKKQKCKKIC